MFNVPPTAMVILRQGHGFRVSNSDRLEEPGMLEPFGEVGGYVPELFSGEIYFKNDEVKSYREN